MIRRLWKYCGRRIKRNSLSTGQKKKCKKAFRNRFEAKRFNVSFSFSGKFFDSSDHTRMVSVGSKTKEKRHSIFIAFRDQNDQRTQSIGNSMVHADASIVRICFG